MACVYPDLEEGQGDQPVKEQVLAVFFAVLAYGALYDYEQEPRECFDSGKPKSHLSHSTKY